ncbi:MAG: hypothetical protein ACYC4H_12895 [Desulfocucumaceae bacterium]
MAYSQDDYTNQYLKAAQTANQPAYTNQLSTLRQAYDRNKLNMQQSRGNIQNTYTAGSNQLGELRSQTAADYAAGQNKINEQQAAQMPQYQVQRNQASAQGAQSGRTLAELMAQKGLGRSGSFLTGQVGIMNQTGGQINDISTQENLARYGFANRLSELGTSQANALSGIGNRQAELLQAYNQNLGNLDQQSALYGTQLGESERALQQQYADRMAAAGAQAPLAYEDYAARLAGMTGQYEGQDTLAKQLQAANIANQRFNQYLQGAQYGTNSLLGVAGVTGQFNQPSGYYPGDIATYYQNLLKGAY